MRHNECCGKPMKYAKGLKVSTDPKCQYGRAVRHAKDFCACEYQKLYYCQACRKQRVDGSVAPYLLMDVFYI